MKDKLLITGVGGFIASHVARRFLREGFQVVGVDDFSSGYPKNVPEGLQFIHGDLSDLSVISRIPKDCQIIFHLAGQSSGEVSFDDPVADLRKNTTSTLNLIKYGVKNHIRRFIYASSMSVYGAATDKPTAETSICMPLSCYGVSKLAAEGYLRAYRKYLPYVVLRMFNVYGPGQDMGNLRQGMVSIYLAQALVNGRIEVKGSIDRYRDFIFIDDVVEAWYRATFLREAENQIVNVGTGIKTSVAELLERISIYVPGTNYYISENTPGDQTGIYADTSHMKYCLNMHKFTHLNSGLKTFTEWAKDKLPRV